MTWRHPSGSKTLTGVKPSLICGPLKSGLLIMMLQFVAINQKFFLITSGCAEIYVLRNYCH